MKRNRYPNRLKGMSLLFALTLSLAASGCTSTLVRRDIFIPVEDEKTDFSTLMTSKPIIESNIEKDKGQLLYYDYATKAMLYAAPVPDGPKGIYELFYIDKDGTESALGQTSATFTSGTIANNGNSIYFVDRNADLSSSILTVTNQYGNTKTEILSVPFDERNNTIAYCPAPDSAVIYVSTDYRIIHRKENGDEKEVFSTLPEDTIPRRIAYSPKDEILIMLASTRLTTGTGEPVNILYRLQLSEDPKSRDMTPIIINVSDFSVSEILQKTIFTKKTLTSGVQLYEYNHSDSKMTPIVSDAIDRIYFSPLGNYVAYTTAISQNSPTQSIWIANTRTGIKTQLTVNTSVYGNLYWEYTEDGIYYCKSLTAGAETNYSISLVKFRFASELVEQ